MEADKVNDAQKSIEKFKQSEKLFFRLIENSTDAIALMLPDGTLTYASPSTERVIGYTPEEFMAINGLTLIHPDDLQETMRQLTDIMDTPGKSVQLLYRFCSKDGSWRWLEATATNLLADSEIGAIVGNYRDITDRREAEERAQKSDARFRALIEKSTDAISLVNSDGKILYTSPATEQVLGYNPEEFVALPNPFDILHPEDSALVQKLFTNLLATPNASVTASYRVRHKDGTYRWIDTIGTNLLDDPDVGAVISNYRDVTERKHFEQLLREREARVRHLVDANIIGIVFWDPVGNILDANDVFLEMIGYTREDMQAGRVRWNDMTPPEFAPLDEQAMQEMRQYGAVVRPFEKEYVRKDGSRIPILVGGAFLDTTQREGIAFILDISMQKDLEKRKDEFISMASHELKTPITSIKAYTQVLLTRFQKRGDEETVRFLTRMDTQLTKLSTLIGDLLDITKIQVGKLVFREEAFMLDVLVQEIVENMQEITQTHRLQLECEPDIPLYADKDRIGQVVINLLTNAIKYSPQADRVVICVEQQEEWAVVSVQDFGIGVAEAHQARIFERFYQVTDPLEKTFPGLGIGLYISSEIIRRFHGEMWVQSKKGEGSTFGFRLPLKKIDNGVA